MSPAVPKAQVTVNGQGVPSLFWVRACWADCPLLPYHVGPLVAVVGRPDGKEVSKSWSLSRV